MTSASAADEGVAGLRFREIYRATARAVEAATSGLASVESKRIGHYERTSFQGATMWLREAGWSEENARIEIAADPSLLGIPPSWRVKQQRPHGEGKPDIFFASPEGDAIAVVELQLGGVDRYHITKTVEYLAREREATPTAACRCVLVAESFTGKYGRLAEGFARIAPMELFRMTVEQAGDQRQLVVTRHYPPKLSSIPVEDDTREARWRSAIWFGLAENLLEQIMGVDPAWSPKFNGQYIGGQRLGGDCNSIAIREDRDGFQLELKLERSAQTDEILIKAGYPIEYRNDREHTGPRRRHYRVRVGNDRGPVDLAPLHELVIQAHERFREFQESA